MDDDDVSHSLSPSPPSSSALPVDCLITVTVASLYASATGGGGSGGGGGGRKDTWSDGATSALTDAWGERFVALGRGSLRHPQWQEVADTVSSRDGYSKAPKSDVHCKNRIDTLKKKYKVERAKPVSAWQFFDHLDFLLAPTYGNKPGSGGGGGGGHNSNSRTQVPRELLVSFPQRSRTPLMPAAGSAAKRRAPSPEPSVSSESFDGFPPVSALPAVNDIFGPVLVNLRSCANAAKPWRTPERPRRLAALSETMRSPRSAPPSPPPMRPRSAPPSPPRSTNLPPPRRPSLSDHLDAVLDKTKMVSVGEVSCLVSRAQGV